MRAHVTAASQRRKPVGAVKRFVTQGSPTSRLNTSPPDPPARSSSGPTSGRAAAPRTVIRSIPAL